MGWRLERASRKSGTAFILRGPGPARPTVLLGMVSEERAALALASVRALAGAELMPAWHAWHDREPTRALRALFGEDACGAVRRLSRDWPGVRLRDYHAEVYAPWRRTTAAGWPAEERIWPRILRELGHLPLRAITAWTVADYLDELRIERDGPRKGLPASGNTKRLHRAALLALFTRAHRLRHVAEVPDLAAFRIAGSTRARERRAPLTSDELRALLAACGPQLRAIVALCAGCGLRPSEAVRVRWDDVRWHPEAPTLQVRGSKTPEATAEIPLTPIAAPWLRAWHAACGAPTAGLAFQSQRTGTAYRATGWRKALATAAERAGITRPITPYLLRATFATLAWRAGLAREDTARILRHTNPRMLDEVYARPSASDLSARVRGLTL